MYDYFYLVHWAVYVLLCNYHCNHWSENNTQKPFDVQYNLSSTGSAHFNETAKKMF